MGQARQESVCWRVVPGKGPGASHVPDQAPALSSTWSSWGVCRGGGCAEEDGACGGAVERRFWGPPPEGIGGT